MGQDDLMLEREDRSFTSPNKYVCCHCVEDVYLKGLIRHQMTGVTCSYCHAKTRKAAPVASIMPTIAETLFRHYSDATFAGCTFDREAPEPVYLTTQDALSNLPLECHDDLMDDVVNGFVNQQWLEAPDDGLYLQSQAHEEWAWSWDKFSNTVKHQTRFHFAKQTKRNSGDTLLSAAEMLPFLGSLVRKHRMVRTVRSGTVIFRARQRLPNADWPLDAKNLGAPQPGIAIAGRMNPAGIAYFYASFEQGTAIDEVVPRQIEPAQKTVAVGTWKTTRDVFVLDLTDIFLPSVFDASKKREHQGALFLTHFLNAISQPISRDGSEHVDYVPTQVVSEYFAQVFKPIANSSKRIDGIKFASAEISAGRNLVFFPARQHSRERFDQVTLESFETRDCLR